MARNQTWNQAGELIEDIEVPDEISEEEAQRQEIKERLNQAKSTDEKVDILLEALGL